ncbi:MAG: c-type cytochrome biogenesis protein CcmI [Nitrospira sp.]|nr:MAG: c-type cytochrome biogenesis protein CcmI [Nitrospira sp.]
MTLTFWLIASAMTVLVLGLLLRPLLKRTATATGEQEKTLHVYRQQFAELEQDRTNGLLTDEQYQLARRELERRLLEETGATETSPIMVRRQVNSRLVALALAMIIPTVSGVLYWTLGNPFAMTHPTASPMTSQGSSEDDRQLSDGLNALAEQLKKKLEQNPNDGVGWALLARSYMAMERHADAVPIFEKAVKLNPDNAQLLADYADALAVHQGRKLEGKPDLLIQKALKIDPRNVKALMLAGTIAFNRQDYARAAKDWEQARANLPPDAEPEATQELTASIAEAQRRLGGGQVTMTANAKPAAPAKPTGPTGQAGPSRAITGKVILGPAVAAKASPTDTLFVFARAVNGPPMPVSIVRATKKDLPFTFRLDDSTSPMPSRKLSDMDKVVIVARLSKSGRAAPESGDLEGMSEPVKPGTNGLTVVIDQARP